MKVEEKNQLFHQLMVEISNMKVELKKHGSQIRDIQREQKVKQAMRLTHERKKNISSEDEKTIYK